MKSDHGRQPGPSCDVAVAWIRALLVLAAVSLYGCSSLGPASSPSAPLPTSADKSACTAERTLHADVVAFEQAYVLNRFGAYVPAGMMYALRRDLQAIDPSRAAGPGNVRLRDDKRPRPLVLRAHEGGCLQVTLRNWLSPIWDEEGGAPPYPTIEVAGVNVPAAPAHLGDPQGVPTSRKLKPLAKTDRDAPRTRSASLFVTGLETDAMRAEECPLDTVCGGDGTYVGLPDQQGTVFRDQAARDKYRTGSLIPPAVPP